MKRFRLKAALILTGCFSAFCLLIVLVFVIYSVDKFVSQQRYALKMIARGIEDELRAADAKDAQLPEDLRDRIQHMLTFANREGNLTFAVTNLSRTQVCRGDNFPTELDPKYFEDTQDDDKLFVLDMISEDGAELDDVLKVWHVMMRLTTDRHHILVSSYRDFEVVERTVEGALIALAVIVLLSFASVTVYTKRIISPMETIARTVKRVEEGDLDARIPTDSFADEVLELARGLNQAFSRMQEAFQKISQFSSDAAHELRTPLTAIRGNIEVCLSQNRTGDDYRETLGGCLEDVARLSGIVDKLLLLSRPGTPNQEDMGPVRLADLAENCKAHLLPVAQDRNVTLDLQIEDDPVVHGDGSLLSRLLANLLDNAVRFSPPGGTVSIRICRRDGRAEIAVRDRGPGIAETNHALIFERFFQVDSGRGGGTGLGLSLVKWIADYHGGNVSVESRPENGTCITFTMALHR